GVAAAGEILEDVNGAEALAGGIVEIGIGGEEIAAEGGINLVGFASGAFAIGAASPLGASLVEKLADVAAGERDGVRLQVNGEGAVRAQDAAIGGVDEDQIADGVECIEPLAAGGGGVLEQLDVLDREAQEIGDVGEEVALVFFE